MIGVYQFFHHLSYYIAIHRYWIDNLMMLQWCNTWRGRILGSLSEGTSIRNLPLPTSRLWIRVCICTCVHMYSLVILYVCMYVCVHLLIRRLYKRSFGSSSNKGISSSSQPAIGTLCRFCLRSSSPRCTSPGWFSHMPMLFQNIVFDKLFSFAFTALSNPMYVCMYVYVNVCMYVRMYIYVCLKIQ